MIKILPCTSPITTHAIPPSIKIFRRRLFLNALGGRTQRTNVYHYNKEEIRGLWGNSDDPNYSGKYEDMSNYWNKTVGAKQTYIYSLKADYPISVGIIGKKNPAINLSNTSSTGGDSHLTDNIRNDKGKLNIRAASGSINQNSVTTIYIENINVSKSGGNVKVNAVSTSDAGDIDINATGNAVVNNIKSANGSISLTSSGNIKQTTNATTINARNIKLESTGGRFVDALDKVNANAANDENELVKSWIDMGLIAGDDDHKGAYLNRLE